MDATLISGSRCCADGFETPDTAVVSKFIIHESVALCLKFRQTVLKNRRSTKLCSKLLQPPACWNPATRVAGRGQVLYYITL
jgi:hypothetical protein